MREITILKDGVASYMPIIIKRIRTIIYFILTLTIVAVAVIKRHDMLDASTMVTNIAVIAMVCFPLSVMLSLVAKLFLSIITSTEMCITNKRVFGYIAFGKPCNIAVSDITSATSGRFIFKSLILTDIDGNEYKFIGVRNAERAVQLIEALQKEEKPKSAAERMSEQSSAHVDLTAKELAWYSALRTKGIITASELDYVKKQIIGL